MGHFEAPYFKMLNDASVASAGSYVRTCRRIRNSKKIATIRDFHQNIRVNPTKNKNTYHIGVKPYEKRNFKERFQLDPFDFLVTFI